MNKKIANVEINSQISILRKYYKHVTSLVIFF